MLPRWHIFWGAIFTLLIWILAPNISLIFLALIFFSSFLIDFDHYIMSVLKTKRISLLHAFDYHKKEEIKLIKEKKKGIRKKGDFHLFHTLEFHALIGILGIFWTPFFYIFVGMVFHSLLDLADLLHKDRFYRREFFLINWLIKKRN